MIFMHLLSKLSSEICQKLGSWEEKAEQNRLKVSTLPPFVRWAVLNRYGVVRLFHVKWRLEIIVKLELQ